LGVTDDPASLRRYCATVTILGMTESHYARSFENGKSIALCLALHPSLQTLWPQEKLYI
jgi:hypothetical protein